jgi:hypothetical protein
VSEYRTCPTCAGRGVVPLDDDYYAALEEHVRRTSAAIDAALKPQPAGTVPSDSPPEGENMTKNNGNDPVTARLRAANAALQAILTEDLAAALADPTYQARLQAATAELSAAFTAARGE